jgi:hypothetical protein
MLTELRRLFWPIEKSINEFLQGDLGWMRVVFLFLAGFIYMGVAILIQLFVNPQVGETWLLQVESLDFLPESVLRFLGMAFHWESLRYFLLPVFTGLIALFFGARYVQDIYNLNNYSSALKYLFASMFSVSYPFLRIENGKPVVSEDETNPLMEIGGPGLVLISPGNAVLFERLRRPSSVRGPGMHLLSRFESIKEVVNLVDQHGVIEKVSATSKDGITVTVHDIQFRYRCGQRAVGYASRSKNNPYPYSVNAIRNLVYNRAMRLKDGKQEVVPLEAAINTAIDGDILRYIRTHLLDAIIAPRDDREPEAIRQDPRTSMGQKGYADWEPGENVPEDQRIDPRSKIRRMMNSPATRRNFQNMGVELIWFDIGHFSFEDPEVEEQRIHTWSAELVGQGSLLRATGEAQRQAMQEMARAQVQSEMLVSMVHALHEAGLSGDLQGQGMYKVILLRASQVLESLSGVYDSKPYIEEI